MKESIKDLKQTNNHLSIILIVLLIICMILALACNYYQKKQKEQSESYTTFCENIGFYESLERIQKNCNSMFITKIPGRNNLGVFTKVCIEKDYCKSDYIPLEECLK